MFEKKDLEKCGNVVSALKRGKFEVTGEEAIALYQSIFWLVELYKKIEMSLEVPQPQQSKEKADDGHNVQSRPIGRSRQRISGSKKSGK